ncbi:MAG TPA: DoxX family protein [Pseudonocardiaceae bacterium]|nr:DoxX family protein [Pseudonocardiaceae bacterium]
MSTYSDDGLFYSRRKAETSSSSTYNSAGRDPSSSTFDPDEEFGYTGGDTTSVIQPGGAASNYGPSPFDEDDKLRTVHWRGNADFGLLVLRVVLGGIFVGHGLRHLFGLFHGTGLDPLVTFIRVSGYTDPHLLGYIAGITELVGGILLVLGLFTPLATAALLGLLANVVVLNYKHGFFAPNGIELEVILGAAVFALLFTGPGRVSLDRPTPWFRRPGLNAFIFLFLSAAASVLFLFVLRDH